MAPPPRPLPPPQSFRFEIVQSDLQEAQQAAATDEFRTWA